MRRELNYKEQDLLRRAKRYNVSGELSYMSYTEEDIKTSEVFEGYELSLVMAYIKAEKDRKDSLISARVKWDSLVEKYSHLYK